MAMGAKMEPSYANLFVGYIEHKSVFNQYNGSKPELYRSYIDDCVNSVDKNQIILQYSHRRSTTVSSETYPLYRKRMAWDGHFFD